MSILDETILLYGSTIRWLNMVITLSVINIIQTAVYNTYNRSTQSPIKLCDYEQQQPF